MNVLISGGAGYIGSITSDVLIRSGHDVTVVDNLSTGHFAAVPREARFIKDDLSDLAAIRCAFKYCKPEAVIHFAGHTNVGESMQDPLKYIGDNIICGINLLRVTIESGVRRFILSSTANLFSNNQANISEKTPIHPGSPYGESKFYLERALAWLDRTHGLRYASLRYFNAAGATKERGECHDPETHLIPLVLQCALGKREKVSIYGTDYDTPDGTCVRDYIHVGDLADAHLLALQATEHGSCAYNLGNGNGFSVKEVIDAARRITGRSIVQEALPRREGDVARLVADSTAIRQDLKWLPRVANLDDIVRSTWSWMQEYPNGYEREAML